MWSVPEGEASPLLQAYDTVRLASRPGRGEQHGSVRE
jgi:hypothetical protein